MLLDPVNVGAHSRVVNGRILVAVIAPKRDDAY